MAFAARVRTGILGRGATVKVGTVSKAMSAVSKTIELANEPSPIYRAPEVYILPLARCIEGMRRSDEPSIPQLAIPVTVPYECYRRAYATTNHKAQATADLCIIAFFYLLRVGEYTTPRTVRRNGQQVRATRTIQFRVQDVGFFKDGKLLPRTSPLAALLEADAATLKISNQKNGRMGQTVHHETCPGATSPVRALARRIHHILAHGGTNASIISTYAPDRTVGQSTFTASTIATISPSDMITTIRSAVRTLKLHEAGIDPDLVGVHSLRAGGAMALKLRGKSDTTIMKIGRWSGLTFLDYIHNQIAHLSKDLSTEMSIPIPFLNIASVN